MKVEFFAREGKIIVEASEGVYTGPRSTIIYQPQEEAFGERRGEIPSLKEEEVRDLIKVLQFVLENA